METNPVFETQSPELDKIAAALTIAQAKLSPAIKGSTNPHFRSKYADLQAVWEVARPVLAENKLSIVQTFNESNGETVTIVTTLLHISGQYLRSALTLKPTKPDPQGIGSAITYGRRYSLSAMLGIVADEDDDGNAASQKPEGNQSSQPRQATPPTVKNWKDVIIHFGKNENKMLGELPKNVLAWYQNEWWPKPFNGQTNPKDEFLRAALDASIVATAPKATPADEKGAEPKETTKEAKPESDEIPF